MRPRSNPHWWCLAAGLVVPISCVEPSPSGSTPPASDGGRDVVLADTVPTIPGAFNDHTLPRLGSAEDFHALAVEASGLFIAKAILTDFGDPARRDVRFADAHFYALHDEWYWFRLLNGQPVPGDDVAPVRGRSFGSVAEVYAWALAQPSLPLDLAFYDGRLYSQRFYQRAFGPSRAVGLATLLHRPAREALPERWAFELEYSDELTHELLEVFFDTLRARLPASIAGELRFLVRSAEQEALATRMESERLRDHDRLLRYRDLVVAGAREVYSEGITAGRLTLVPRGALPTGTGPEDILVFETTPDALPGAGGVITATPQTPLSHINLLARNRGIPNAFIAGVEQDPAVRQLARGHAPVLLYTQAPGRVVLAALTEEQYQRYRALSAAPPPPEIPQPPPSIPYVIDLELQRPEEAATLVPSIGGKCAGMVVLAHTPDLARPDRPQAITVRAYREHLAGLRPEIERALGDPGFERDSRVRYLTLLGAAATSVRYPSDVDRAWLDEWLRARPSGTPLGDLLRAGGIRGLVEGTPLAPETLSALRSALTEAFRALAPTQGLRFRSSSNAEDLAGFNGAGLYESYTGFLSPEAQRSASDRAKTIERAILRVWGSFWSPEAFEERRAARIDHLSAAMAVLVHPRFDDALEESTGVCTLTLLPPNDPVSERLEVNVHPGTASVANPDPTVLPEIVRVTRPRDGGPTRVERMRRSTLSPSRDVLTDASLERLLATTTEVTRAWLARDNAARTEARRSRSLTLDFEFHAMASGWPALADGQVRPARLVLKQARPLEPPLRASLPEATAWPVPWDVLVRARRASALRCEAAPSPGVTLTVNALRVLTDASLTPDPGYSTTPFEAEVVVALRGGDLPSLGWSAGATWASDHTRFTYTPGAPGRWVFHPGTPAREGLDSLTLGADGAATFTLGARTWSTRMVCTEDVRFASPRDYLLGLVPAGG